MRRSAARRRTKRNAPTRAPVAHASAKTARTRVDGGAASGTQDGGTLKKRAGRRRPASEITTVPAITSSHKSWRARAGVPRSASAATSPASTKSAIFASAGAGTKLMSLPRPALGAPHQVAEPIEVRVAHPGAAQPVDDVHDLALAAPQAVVTGWRHERQYAN